MKRLGGGGITFGGVVVDGAGNVFFTDPSDNILYEKPSIGGNTVVVSFAFTDPQGVAVDGSGNVYVADYYEVQKIAPMGGGTTVLSSSFAFGTLTGVAVDSAGNVYVSSYGNNAVYKIIAVGGTTSSSSAVQQIGHGFTHPGGVAVDPAGNVYVIDSSGTGVKEIVASGGALSTSSVVNSLGGSLSSGTSLAVDAAGNVIVVDAGYNQIKRVQVTAPPSIAFRSTPAGTTSPDSPLAVQLQNVGNASATFTSVTASTDFSVATGYLGSCGTTLSSESVCNMLASFTPATGGSKTGTLTITDNANNSPQVVPLSGTATYVSQTINFPAPAKPANINSTATLSASSTSGLPVTFSITGGTGSATLSGTNNATITYTGSGTVQITASQAGNGVYAAASPVSNTVTVPAAFASLLVSGFPSGSVTGVAQSVMVTALDTSGATYTGYTGTVTFTGSDAAAALPASYTFTAADMGTHVFSVTLNTGGTQSLNVTDGSKTAMQSGIVTTGYVWLVDGTGALTKLYANGSAISSSSGYTGGGTPTTGLAFDSSSNAWSLNKAGNLLVEFSRIGAALSGSGFSGGGLSTPNLLAIDGLGQVWITNNNGTLSLFSNTGTALSPASGFTGVTSTGTGYSAPTGIAIDASGNVWVANSNNTMIEVLGGAAPAAPLSTAITNNTTGARP